MDRPRRPPIIDKAKEKADESEVPVETLYTTALTMTSPAETSICARIVGIPVHRDWRFRSIVTGHSGAS